MEWNLKTKSKKQGTSFPTAGLTSVELEVQGGQIDYKLE